MSVMNVHQMHHLNASSYALSTSFICYCCEEEWSNDMRRIIGREEICTSCIDKYKTIAGLRNGIIKK